MVYCTDNKTKAAIVYQDNNSTKFAIVFGINIATMTQMSTVDIAIVNI